MTMKTEILMLRLACGFSLWLAMAGPAAALRLQPVYETGDIKLYGVSVQSTVVDPNGKRAAKPAMQASAVFQLTVLNAMPDGTVKMRLAPVGAVLNGRSLRTTEQLGPPVVIKLNRAGKVIAVEVPATRYTQARVVDLQPYMSQEWRNTPWIPRRDLRAGESWVVKKQDSRLKQSGGEMRVRLASEKESHAGVQCCRFDATGSGNVIVEEVMALVAAQPATGMPQSVAARCREYARDIRGTGALASESQCWVSLEDAGIVAASGTSRMAVDISGGKVLRAKRSALVLESESRLRRLTKDEARSFLAAYPQTVAPRLAGLCSEEQGASGPMLAATGLRPQTYSAIIVGMSVFNLLPFPSPLEVIDISFKLHGRLLPDGRDYTNFKLTMGIKVGCSLPFIDFISLFVGSGYHLGDMAKSIEAGSSSVGVSLAALFIGTNFTPSSGEVGLSSSIVNVSAGYSLSLNVAGVTEHPGIQTDILQ